MQPELFYFRWSHYNEKVRWALDYKGVPYRGRRLLPGPHRATALRLSGQSAVPILVLNGRAIADSTRIIAALEETWPARSLYPRDPVLRRRALELEEFFDEELGPHVRRVLMATCYPHSVYLAHLFDSEEPWLKRWLYRGVLHARKRALARMDFSAGAVAASWRKVEDALARLERELGANPYLAGDAFSVADLTAAALLAVVTLPAELPCLPRLPLPPEVAEVNARCEGPAAQWARAIYRRHRHLPAPAPAPAAGIVAQQGAE